MSIDKNLLIMPDDPNLDHPIPAAAPAKVKEEKKRESVYEVHVCVPCKRLFRSLNTLLKHQ